MASLVLVLLWLFDIGSLLATIFGGVAPGQIARSNGSISGKCPQLAGLILEILGQSLVFAGVLWVVLGPSIWGRLAP